MEVTKEQYTIDGLVAALAERDARIAALEEVAETYRANAEAVIVPLDARIAALGNAMWRIRDAVMHEGGWCYDYETAEGKRIADAVNAIWRETRDQGLPVLNTALTAPPPYPSASDQFTHTHHYPHGDEGEGSS
jgi:hypothetical protein